MAGLAIMAVLGAPRVIGFSPAPDLAAVSAMTRVTITFSQPMNPQSVEARLTIEPSTPGRLLWEGTALTFIPQEPWPGGTRVEVQLASGARSTRFLPLLESYEWSFEISAPRISYLSSARGAAQVYLQSVGGENPVQLTDVLLGVYEYEAAPAESAIVYAAERADGGTDIWMLELESGQTRLLHACAQGTRCRAAHLSLDGTTLAFEQLALQGDSAAGQLLGPPRVWALNLRQDDEPFPVGPEGHVTSVPSWSPQGVLAYYDNTLRAIVMVDPAEGGELQPYRYFPSELGSVGTWSPDGAYLVFPDMIFPPSASPAGGEAEEGRVQFYSHLFRAEVATGEVVDLWRPGTGLVEDASPVYSPDGRWIGFARKYLEEDRWTIGRQLWLMRADGSGAHPLTKEPDYNCSALAWSPDSTSLVFMRFNETAPTQAAEVWLIGMEGENPQRLVVGGYLPQWMP